MNHTISHNNYFNKINPLIMMMSINNNSITKITLIPIKFPDNPMESTKKMADKTFQIKKTLIGHPIKKLIIININLRIPILKCIL